VTTVMQDEGDAPTAPEPLPTEDDKSTVVKLATLWIKIDGLFERMKDVLHKAKDQIVGAESKSDTSAADSKADRGSSINKISINLGGSSLIVIGACGVVMGIDIAERSAQERKSAEQATAVQMAIIKQTADLQRDWILNTSQLQRDWEKQTVILTEKTQDMQRQWRMTEMKLDAWGVTARRAGLKLPRDFEMGPGGNPDSASFNIPLLKTGATP
jgi:hypothetical protein